MTPEQMKANELVDKFTPYMYCFMGSGMLSNDYDEHIVRDNAKKCALIAIDAIISQLEEMLEPENTFFWHGDKAGQTTDGYGLLDFYKSVKLEIPNI